MSVSYSAVPFFGIGISKSVLEFNTPNPLWGKCKFDPDTGRKVEQFIKTTFDLEEALSKTRLDSVENCGNYIYVGRKLGPSIDLNGDHHVIFKPLSAEVEKAVEDDLEKLCAKFDIQKSSIKPKYYIVSEVRV